MGTPKINAIAVIGKNRVLGKDNKLIWKIPEDQKRYKELTMGHPLIMGRKTYESIGRPLPGRTNIVITRSPDFEAPGCIVVHTLRDAIEEAKKVEDKEIFINGGAQIYAEALPLTDKLYLTVVGAEAEGDAFFPPYDDFKKVSFKQSGEYQGFKYTFLDLEK